MKRGTQEMWIEVEDDNGERRSGEEEEETHRQDNRESSYSFESANGWEERRWAVWKTYEWEKRLWGIIDDYIVRL